MCSYKFDNKIKKYKYSEILQKFHKFVLSKKSFVQLFSSEKVFWKTGFAKLGRTFLTVPCVKQAKVTKRTTWEYTKNIWEYTKNIWEYTLFGVDEAPPPSIRKSVVDIFHIATFLSANHHHIPPSLMSVGKISWTIYSNIIITNLPLIDFELTL